MIISLAIVFNFSLSFHFLINKLNLSSFTLLFYYAVNQYRNSSLRFYISKFISNNLLEWNNKSKPLPEACLQSCRLNYIFFFIVYSKSEAYIFGLYIVKLPSNLYVFENTGYTTRDEHIKNWICYPTGSRSSTKLVIYK